MPNIHVNTQEDIEIGESLKTSLLVSRFSIHELVPQITLHTTMKILGRNIKKSLFWTVNFPDLAITLMKKEKKRERLVYWFFREAI